MLMSWIHRAFLHHMQTHSRVTVPMFDPSARGILIRCECGKVWAL